MSSRLLWLLLLVTVAVALGARLLGLTEELDRLTDACVVVLTGYFLMDLARRPTAQGRAEDRADQ